MKRVNVRFQIIPKEKDMSSVIGRARSSADTEDLNYGRTELRDRIAFILALPAKS